MNVENLKVFSDLVNSVIYTKGTVFDSAIKYWKSLLVKICSPLLLLHQKSCDHAEASAAVIYGSKGITDSKNVRGDSLYSFLKA